MDIIASNLVDAVDAQAADVAEVLASDLGPLLDRVSTTAALAAVGNAINTTGKYAGKQVFNETTGILVVAAGAAAADVWKNAGTGATAHTPA
jgi:hypothetical protein